MVKKAFMRSLEAVMAMAIMFTFLAIYTPYFNTAKSDFANEDVLSTLQKEQDFRDCIITENASCINRTLATRLEKYDFAINISKNQNSKSQNLPQKRIFSESAFIAGNSTYYEPRILRIYYWAKQ